MKKISLFYISFLLLLGNLCTNCAFGFNYYPNYNHHFNHYYPHRYNFPYRFFRNGVVTGYTPPINSYSSYPYSYNPNRRRFNNIRRYFTSNFSNSNFTPINPNFIRNYNQNFTPLFNNNRQFPMYNQFDNGFNFNGNSNYQSGASVTVID